MQTSKRYISRTPDLKAQLVAHVPQLEEKGRGRHRPIPMDALEYPQSIYTVVYNAFLRAYNLNKDLLTPSEQDEVERILDNIHPSIFVRNVPLAMFEINMQGTIMKDRHLVQSSWPSAAYDALARLDLLWLADFFALMYQFLYIYMYVPLLAPDSRMREFMHRAVHDVVDALRDAKEDIFLRTAEDEAKQQDELDAEIAEEDLLLQAEQDAMQAYREAYEARIEWGRRLREQKEEEKVTRLAELKARILAELKASEPKRQETDSALSSETDSALSSENGKANIFQQLWAKVSAPRPRRSSSKKKKGRSSSKKKRGSAKRPRTSSKKKTRSRK